jgi:predicted RNase H-like nuclease (RuvC/YqgF family)
MRTEKGRRDTKTTAKTITTKDTLASTSDGFEAIRTEFEVIEATIPEDIEN